MKICPSCHFYNLDKNEKCLKCGTSLDHKEIIEEQPVRHRFQLFYNIGIFFRKLGTRLRAVFASRLPDYLPHRFHWLAGWLGLIPGLGQIYNHQYKKAVGYFLIFSALVCVSIITITRPYSNWILALTVLFLLWSFNDGLSTAARINGQAWAFRHTLTVFSYLLFMLGIILLVAQFFLSPAFKLIYISQDVLAPGLRQGDRVFVEGLTYLFRDPRRGEVVFYDPPRFYIEVLGAGGSAMYTINERRSFERVMGLPGDVLARKDGVFYLNGQQLAKKFWPLNPNELPQNFKLGPVPEDRFMVLITHHAEEKGIGTFGGTSPRLNEPGVILKDWDKASIVTKKEIFGRTILIYNPPQHRRLLLP